MTKNRMLLITIASSAFIVMAIFQNAAYAQYEPPTGRGPNQDIREQNKARRGEAKDLRAQKAKDTRVERVQLRGANVISRSGLRIDRLAKTVDKTATVAQKLIDKGQDVGDVQTLVQTAKDQLAQARSMQAEAQVILDGLTADTLQSGAADFKAKMLKIYKVLGQSRQNVINAVQALKTARSSANAVSAPAETTTN